MSWSGELQIPLCGRQRELPAIPLPFPRGLTVGQHVPVSVEVSHGYVAGR